MIDEVALKKRLQVSAKPTQLASRTAWPTLGAIAGNWLAITACIAALYAFPWYLHPVFLVLIAARQHALLILMHDGSHFLFCRSKALNDLISDVFCGFPFGVTTRTYRANHVRHHEHLNTGADPDLVRTVGPDSHHEEWLFPMPYYRLFSFFVKDVLGRGFFDLVKSLHEIGMKSVESQYRGPALVQLAYLASLVALLYFSPVRWIIVYGWMVPMLAILPAILRLRSLAEHYAIPRQSILSGSRTVKAKWFEGFLIAPHNVSMHLEHHLFPYVPWHRLPELHNRLMQVEEYRLNAHVNGGYLVGSNSVLTDVSSVVDDPRLAFKPKDLNNR